MYLKISILFALIFVTGCKKDSVTKNTLPPPQAPMNNATPHKSLMRYSGPDYSQKITIDTANRMIQSYLTSINYPTNNTKLRSFTFDADTLRNYLLNSDIKTLKFVLAHKPQYMNSGGFGQDAANAASAVTFIVVGLSGANEYIYTYDSKVYDHMRLCPTLCDEVSPLLVND